MGPTEFRGGSFAELAPYARTTCLFSTLCDRRPIQVTSSRGKRDNGYKTMTNRVLVSTVLLALSACADPAATPGRSSDSTIVPFPSGCAEEGEIISALIDHMKSGKGEVGDLLRVAKEQLEGQLQRGDIVRRKGRTIQVVRNGAVVMEVDYKRDDHGGWLQTGSRACD